MHFKWECRWVESPPPFPGIPYRDWLHQQTETPAERKRARDDQSGSAQRDGFNQNRGGFAPRGGYAARSGFEQNRGGYNQGRGGYGQPRGGSGGHRGGPGQGQGQGQRQGYGGGQGQGYGGPPRGGGPGGNRGGGGWRQAGPNTICNRCGGAGHYASDCQQQHESRSAQPERTDAGEERLAHALQRIADLESRAPAPAAPAQPQGAQKPAGGNPKSGSSGTAIRSLRVMPVSESSELTFVDALEDDALAGLRQPTAEDEEVARATQAAFDRENDEEETPVIAAAREAEFERALDAASPESDAASVISPISSSDAYVLSEKEADALPEGDNIGRAAQHSPGLYTQALAAFMTEEMNAKGLLDRLGPSTSDAAARKIVYTVPDHERASEKIDKELRTEVRKVLSDDSDSESSASLRAESVASSASERVRWGLATAVAAHEKGRYVFLPKDTLFELGPWAEDRNFLREIGGLGPLIGTRATWYASLANNAVALQRALAVLFTQAFAKDNRLIELLPVQDGGVSKAHNLILAACGLDLPTRVMLSMTGPHELNRLMGIILTVASIADRDFGLGSSPEILDLQKQYEGVYRQVRPSLDAGHIEKRGV
eukprot:tig00020553_g10512.t1